MLPVGEALALSFSYLFNETVLHLESFATLVGESMVLEYESVSFFCPYLDSCSETHLH